MFGPSLLTEYYRLRDASITIFILFSITPLFNLASASAITNFTEVSLAFVTLRYLKVTPEEHAANQLARVFNPKREGYWTAEFATMYWLDNSARKRGINHSRMKADDMKTVLSRYNF